MGGKSTLQSTVSTDGVETQEKFDLKSWQGLTELLKAGKNALKPEVYAEFRNLVLQYAQHGGDAEYKKRIDDVVATFGRAPIVPAEVEVPEKGVVQKPAHASRRVAPRFDDISFMPESLPPEKVEVVTEPEQAAPEVENISEPTPIPVSVPKTVKVPESIPVPPEPVVEVSLPPIPEPIPVPVPEPIVVPEPTPTSIPAPVPVEVQEPLKPLMQSEPVSQIEQVPFMSLEQCKLRIAEIKRAVNTHFGNPVALMAVPNNLGKVYMTALLNALKASTPGAPGGVGSAMAELERAYKTLMEGDMIAPITASEPVVVPVVEPESIPESTLAPEPNIESVPEPEPIPEQAPAPEPVAETPLPPVPESVPEPEPIPEIPKAPESVVVPPPPSIPESVPEPVSEILKTLVPEHAPVLEPDESVVRDPEVSSEKEAKRMSILERIESEQGLPPLVDPENKEVSRAEVMHSAFEKTDHTISAVVSAVHKKLPPISGSIAELVEDEVSGYDTWQGATGPTSTVRPDTVSTEGVIHRENKHTKKGIINAAHPAELEEQGIDATEIAVKQSELVSPQITTMLNKLLHEWSIFGGSGLFGIGPGGAEHPLYKQLSVLSMGEVVAGRWDGADPKVIKIIKQYVDAWRHEQGITYTLNETFEHYLRRVVQRIVKRQSI